MTFIRVIIGVLVLIGIAILCSDNRKNIKWKVIIAGIGLQIGIGFALFKIPLFTELFDALASGIVKFLSFADLGSKFLFGELTLNNSLGAQFAFKVLPVIVFFSAITAILFHYGILQKIVKILGWILSKTMGLSGPESLAAAANIFIGQTEAPLVIRPYLDKLSKSELFSVMVGGFATIAGSVFSAFVIFLGNGDPVQELIYAKHLLTASLMSAPAALMIAKLIIPENEDNLNKSVELIKEKKAENVLEAITNGTTDGLRLAINVGAMLLVFTAVVGAFNWILEGIGSITILEMNINHNITIWTNGQYSSLNLQFIFGILFAPIAWLIGIPTEDLMLAGQLLGEKTVLNEFFAFSNLGDMQKQNLFQYKKSVILLTYALSGFANIASIGIQVGGIGALAKNQKPTLAKLGIKALIGGTLATLLTATIVGLFL